MIVIVAESGIGYPNGTAPTARITGYARGLVHDGRDVLVLCLNASEPRAPATPLNTHVHGVAHGVRFEYTSGAVVQDPRLWRRQLTKARGRVVAMRRIGCLAGKGDLDAVLLYSKSPVDAVLLRWAARGAPFIGELCELPFPDAQNGLEVAERAAYDRFFFRRFDAVIAISSSLVRHARRFGRSGMPVLQAPVIVDTGQFGPAAAPAEGPPVVGYCGYLNQDKDGVGSLLEAFAGVRDVPGVRLRLIGDHWQGSRIPEYRGKAERLGIADRVDLLGTVSRAEIPGLLASCSVLALARPRSPQADAGMPTKVAEYLASGVPAVLTRTGELDTFLEDGVSAYLVSPGDVPAFTAALRRALLHPKEAAAVGCRGREVAAKRFDYREIGLQVSAFVAELKGPGSS